MLMPAAIAYAMPCLMPFTMLLLLPPWPDTSQLLRHDYYAVSSLMPLHTPTHAMLSLFSLSMLFDVIFH